MRSRLRRDDLLREATFVAGQWSPLAGADLGAGLEVTNPATGALLGRVPRCGAEETEAAVAAAHAALPGWRERTAGERSTILRRWFDLIVAHTEDLATILTAEQGKPLAEARGEIAYAAGFIAWFAEEGRRVYGDVIPSPRSDARILVTKQAVGVVAAITPWNFPAAMVTRKLGPALASGCTTVLKPSELTPFTALALCVLAQEAGVPPGVLNVVCGDAEAIGAVMTSDPRVRKLTFTGSTAVGKRLTAACAPTLKRVSMELGGNAPFIVFDDADIDAAVEGAVLAKFRNTGQTCVCANRILVQAGVYDAFTSRLRERIEGLRVGDGLAGATDQGPLIDARAISRLQRHVADALAQGARLLAGGEARPGPGTFFDPTLLVDVTEAMLVTREEIFGPLAALMPFDDERQALRIANDTPAGLAAYVYTRDLARSWRMLEGLESGMVGINTAAISTEVAPFGGIKESGLGREGSRYGIEDYLDIKYGCVAV